MSSQSNIYRFQTDPRLDHQRQHLAMRGELNIDLVAPIVAGHDFQTVARAVAGVGFLPKDDSPIEYMCSKGFADYLIPVADPLATGATWPTIAVPPTEELLSLESDEREQVLELLCLWRGIVEDAASGRCDFHGWVGGIRVLHPHSRSAMSIRWPWRHREFGKSARPGADRYHKLFGVSVDGR
ncbi:hypothetical protein [Bradyrhizobium liaoningense]|uniref:hypothetical protein n=1 Tax=Bradyrhizobium liaoningense TaxID=43992 RepID=UPI001BA561D8|nr:hypothetical protein [Bradyrhizobium liaoningense]MBR1169675.1 hypothetical protein [Bradyrhizobium liaoningense]